MKGCLYFDVAKTNLLLSAELCSKMWSFSLQDLA